MNIKTVIQNHIKKRPLELRILVYIIRRFRFLYKPIARIYRLYRSMLPDTSYNAWGYHNEEECFVENVEGDQKPLVSIVVPAFNTLQIHLLDMVYSVVNQHYDNWELILVNASTDSERSQAIRDCQDIDKRIRIIDLAENKGIAGNTNVGLDHVRGEYVAFLDHDDLLHPCALHCAQDAIKKHNPDLMYTDEDKIDHQGTLFFGPFCKPKWSPDLLRNVNYINHLTVIRTGLVKQVGGLRPAFDGAQDYDLLLRIIDLCAPKIHHIPQILYHWRAADSSTAKDISNKTYILEAGQTAVRQHLKRTNALATAKVIKNKPGFYKVTYEQPSKISIVIGPVELRRQHIGAWWLGRLIKKLDNTTSFEIIVGEWYKKYSTVKRKNIKIKWVIGANNHLVEATKLVSNETVICFQAMATPLEKTHLSDLAATALHAPVLAVAPILIGPDKTIVDAGFAEVEYGAQRLFNGYKLGENSYYGTTDWARNTIGLTMDVFAVKREVFQKLVDNMDTARLTTLDLRFVYDQYFTDDIPMALLWAHVPLVYKGTLKSREPEDTYFNPKITQANKPMHMKLSTWGKTNERAKE